MLKAGEPVSAWRFVPEAVPRFAQGDAVDVTVSNRLPVPVHVFVRGLDGAAALEPMVARPPIPPGGSATLPVELVHAGTLLLDARLGGGDMALPLLPLVVTERQPPLVDRDEVLLIEDWRLKADSEPIYTVNGEASWSLKTAAGERLRLRVVNGAQRHVLAVQFASADVRVVAIDGQPSEPFLAREGRLVLAPGTRIDAMVDTLAPGSVELTVNDGTRTVNVGTVTVTGPGRRTQPLSDVKPLPSNVLPQAIALQSALRVDVPLDSDFAVNQPPLYRVKRGRAVVLALANSADDTVIFSLHGHHLRLLDRLDDGWKPFWLDTVAVPGKQTVRVAFSAANTGIYLMEWMVATAGSLRKLRSYTVEP